MKNNKKIKKVKFNGYAMELSNEQRARAVEMLEAGVNQSVVAREFGVHRWTISRLQSKFRETNTVADRQVPDDHVSPRYVRTGLYV